MKRWTVLILLAMLILPDIVFALSAAQKKLMARRGAQVVATRNLLRKLAAHKAPPEDGRSFTETIRGYIRGIRVIDSKEHPDGRVVVTVEHVGKSGRRVTATGWAYPPRK